MKVFYPDYYDKFKCIDKECTDTCCAGWEVDVDDAKYRYYRSVDSKIGDRLKSVMIPNEEGQGCSFELSKDKRCPFLNAENLCDIYIELGEEALCKTCTEFPRFIHDYGAIREVGLAPSCFTAALLMVERNGHTQLVEKEDRSLSVMPHDMDPDLFMELKKFRKNAFNKLFDDTRELKDILIELAEEAGVIDEEFELCEQDDNAKKDDDNIKEDPVSFWISDFEEIINENWLTMENINKSFLTGSSKEQIKKKYTDFRSNTDFADAAFRQLLFYYFYRYILEVVNRGTLLATMKMCLTGYICVKRICAAMFDSKGSISSDEMADIFHLYSRQLEHSDINFERVLEHCENDHRYNLKIIFENL